MQSEHVHMWRFIKTFQLYPVLKSLIVKCLWLTVSWNWRCFWDSNSWMLYFLHKRIEGTFAFTAAGVCNFWPANSKIFLLRLTTKILLNFWMVILTFLVWHYLLIIPTQESKCMKSGKAWLPENIWHRGKTWLAKSTGLSGIPSVKYYVTSG